MRNRERMEETLPQKSKTPDNFKVEIPLTHSKLKTVLKEVDRQTRNMSACGASRNRSHEERNISKLLSHLKTEITKTEDYVNSINIQRRSLMPRKSSKQSSRMFWRLSHSSQRPKTRTRLYYNTEPKKKLSFDLNEYNIKLRQLDYLEKQPNNDCFNLKVYNTFSNFVNDISSIVRYNSTEESYQSIADRINYNRKIDIRYKRDTASLREDLLSMTYKLKAI